MKFVEFNSFGSVINETARQSFGCRLLSLKHRSRHPTHVSRYAVEDRKENHYFRYLSVVIIVETWTLQSNRCRFKSRSMPEWNYGKRETLYPSYKAALMVQCKRNAPSSMLQRCRLPCIPKGVLQASLELATSALLTNDGSLSYKYHALTNCATGDEYGANDNPRRPIMRCVFIS